MATEIHCPECVDPNSVSHPGAVDDTRAECGGDPRDSNGASADPGTAASVGAAERQRSESPAEAEISEWSTPLEESTASPDEDETRRYPDSFAPPEAMAAPDLPSETHTTLPELAASEAFVDAPPSPRRTPTLTGVGHMAGTPRVLSELQDGGSTTEENGRITAPPVSADEDPVTVRAPKRPDENAEARAASFEARAPEDGDADASPVDSVEVLRDLEDITDEVTEEPSSRVRDEGGAYSAVYGASSEPFGAEPCPDANARAPRGIEEPSLAPSTIESSTDPRVRRSPMRRAITRPTAKPDRRPLAAAAVVGMLLVSAAWWVPRVARMGTDASSPRRDIAELSSKHGGRAVPKGAAVAPAGDPGISAVVPMEVSPSPAAADMAAQPVGSGTDALSNTPTPARAEPARQAAAMPATGSKPHADDGRPAARPKAEKHETQNPTEALSDSPSRAAPARFSPQAAQGAIASAGGSLHECLDPEVGRISVRASVTFMPSGRVSQVTVDPVAALQGSPVVGCVVRQLRRASVPEFDGERVTVSSLVTIE